MTALELPPRPYQYITLGEILTYLPTGKLSVAINCPACRPAIVGILAGNGVGELVIGELGAPTGPQVQAGPGEGQVEAPGHVPLQVPARQVKHLPVDVQPHFEPGKLIGRAGKDLNGVELGSVVIIEVIDQPPRQGQVLDDFPAVGEGEVSLVPGCVLPVDGHPAEGISLAGVEVPPDIGGKPFVSNGERRLEHRAVRL